MVTWLVRCRSQRASTHVSPHALLKSMMNTWLRESFDDFTFVTEIRNFMAVPLLAFCFNRNYDVSNG